MNYVPGCAHDNDDEDGGESSGDEDIDVISQTARILELDNEFNKAWKNLKVKMSPID